MAKKKNKAKYRAASKNGHSEVSSNTSDASSTNHQFDDDSNDSNQVGEASKPNKKHELEISETQFLQRIFDSYFDGYCSLKSEKRGEVCIQCQRSADPKRALCTQRSCRGSKLDGHYGRRGRHWHWACH